MWQILKWLWVANCWYSMRWWASQSWQVLWCTASVCICMLQGQRWKWQNERSLCKLIAFPYVIQVTHMLPVYSIGFSFYGFPLPFFKAQKKQASLTEKLFKTGFFFFNTNCMFKPSWAFLMVLTILVSKFIFTTYLQSVARGMSLILSSLLKSVSSFLHNYWRCTSEKGKKNQGPFMVVLFVLPLNALLAPKRYLGEWCSSSEMR